MSEEIQTEATEVSTEVVEVATEEVAELDVVAETVATDEAMQSEQAE